MLTVLLIFGAVVADVLLGDPRRYHPLAGFGRLVVQLERRLYGPSSLSPAGRRWRGMVGWLLLVVPPVLLAWLLAQLAVTGLVMHLLLLYLALGGRSLAEHAHRVASRLVREDLPGARQQVAMMVSRDAEQMTAGQICGATIESVLENGNDAIFGALFWFILLGGPGALLYRLSNTLDAMWGYRTPRYTDFGWMAARTDDLLNWLPARLTALGYALLGQTRQALACWRQQAPQWNGPNAGVVMATGAGALDRQLGGPVSYHGQSKPRPQLGTGPAAGVADIDRAVQLVQKTLILWLAILLIGGWLLA